MGMVNIPGGECLLRKCSQNYTSGVHLKNTNMNCVIDMIFSDVFQKFPHLKTAGMRETIEFSNQFASPNGLLKSEFQDWLSEDYNETSYVIGITTIWISNFLKLNHQFCEKDFRNFQICLLAYYFNRILGALPNKIAVEFEKNTINQFEIAEWLSGNDPSIEQSRGENLLKLLHLCSLCYCPSTSIG